MPGYEILIMLAVVVLLVIAALFAVPRVMRTWTAATSPTDERIEYATHMGKAVDQGPAPGDTAERECMGHRETEGAPIRQL